LKDRLADKEERNHAMNVHVRPQFTALDRHLPFEYVALVLQGGRALGAYEDGV
jgi:NTE family protein